MNIEKLEKLSCLKIKNENREALSKSLEDVFKMMSSLDSINIEELVINNKNLSVLDLDTNIDVIKNDSIGLHLTDGFFLAPKVIKKD